MSLLTAGLAKSEGKGPGTSVKWNSAFLWRYDVQLYPCQNVMPGKSDHTRYRYCIISRMISHNVSYHICLFIYVSIQFLSYIGILLMEEILHHLLFMRPYEKWDILHINWLAGSLLSETPRCFWERLGVRTNGTGLRWADGPGPLDVLFLGEAIWGPEGRRAESEGKSYYYL